MVCKKCGSKIEKNLKYCSKCGEEIKQSSKAVPILLFFIIVVIMIFMAIFMKSYLNNEGINFVISDNKYTRDVKNSKKEKLETKLSTKATSDRTNIEFDNVYTNVKINNKNDVEKIIVDEAKKQDYVYSSEKVKQVENELKSKYGILTVNLGEISESLAVDILDTFEKMSKEYPEIKNFLTNLSLYNTNEGVTIAATYAFKYFAYKNNYGTCPMGCKFALGMNTKYFLNLDYFNKVMESGSKSGHFPENAYPSSTVAHELGHVLANVARIKYYNLDEDDIIYMDGTNSNLYKYMKDWQNCTLAKKIVEEAYKKTNKYSSVEEFVKSISGYANSKNKDGSPNYDETIAESVHDVFLNGNNAEEASKQVVKVLKSYL